MSTTHQKQPSIWRRFLTWHGGMNARIELSNLNDRTLRDIGMRRGNERPLQPSSLFWIPGVF